MEKHYFRKKYPQNYIIRKPVPGAFILFLFSFVFTLLYHPLNVHKSFYFGFEATILLYTVPVSLIAGFSIYLLKLLPFFRNSREWTIFKEFLFIYLVLQLAGTTIFLLGFLIEEPAATSRWTLATFLNSSKASFLIYVIPFVFFSLMNARFIVLDFHSNVIMKDGGQDLLVHIHSSLKKESLDFKANELIYAVSDGNYVMFHLRRKHGVEKIPIRNSISEIEQQLEKIPMYYRCHRGFIVNLFQVKAKRGNSSGYVLKMHEIDKTIPVSRSRVDEFDRLIKNFLS